MQVPKRIDYGRISKFRTIDEKESITWKTLEHDQEEID
jgi:hypothetical protein